MTLSKTQRGLCKSQEEKQHSFTSCEVRTSLFLFRPETSEHGHDLTSSVFVVVYPKLTRRSCQCSVSHIPNIHQKNMGFSFHFVAVYSFGEIAVDLRPLGLVWAW
jgi:hypothetical protein